MLVFQPIPTASTEGVKTPQICSFPFSGRMGQFWQNNATEPRFCLKFDRTEGKGEDREMARLLDCMWERESQRGDPRFMVGDGGLAIGHYQIHIDCHPVSYDCAMDFECSRDYTRRMILAGDGWLWTSYDNCL